MKKLIASMLLFGWGTAQAATTLIDFDDLSAGSNVPVPYQGYVFGGFTDNGSEPDWTYPAVVEGLGDGLALSCTPTTNFWAETNCAFSMEHNGGQLFTLNSVDTAFVNVGDESGSGSVYVIGYSESGERVAVDSFDFDNTISFQEQSFAFDSSWTNLASVEFVFDTVSSFNLQIGFVDNISVTAVPIPAAAWLFASGLALLGWFKRKTATV